MFKNWALCLFVAISCMVFAIEGAAYFEFQYGNGPERFVVEITDEEKIQTARDILSGKETDRVHVMGRIIKQQKPYNPHFSFHVDPNSVAFFAQAIEVCDASIQYVEDYLDEVCGAFLPGCFWCPWQSKLTREVEQ